MNTKLLIALLLLGISTSSYAMPEQKGQQQIIAQQQAQQINDAINKAVADGKDPVVAAATATALIVKEAVINNPTDPAAAAATATAAAMTAVINNPNITNKGAAASSIVIAAISAAPNFSADIRTAAVNAAPSSLTTEIIKAANYAVFDNDIQLADANPTPHSNENVAQLNIYVQKQTNIQTAVLNGDITVAQGFALQIQLSATAPAGAGIKSPLALQQEIIVATNAGIITPAQGQALQVTLVATAPVNSGLVLSGSK